MYLTIYPVKKLSLTMFARMDNRSVMILFGIHHVGSGHRSNLVWSDPVCYWSPSSDYLSVTDIFWQLVHFHYKNQRLLRAVPCYPELQLTVWSILFPTIMQEILARTASCQPVLMSFLSSMIAMLMLTMYAGHWGRKGWVLRSLQIQHKYSLFMKKTEWSAA